VSNDAGKPSGATSSPANPATDARRRPSDASELAPPASPRILIAEDDRLMQRDLAGILRTAGYQVDTVEDGQAAIEAVAQGGVDLVLLDVVMPRLGGVEACRLLKAMPSTLFLPVVLVTVKTDTASRVEGLRIGADDYVCKPIDAEELLARIASLLRIKRAHDAAVHQRQRFERLSIHDDLTGLYNYRYLHTRLIEEFKRAERYHEPLACLVVDIDALRVVNEEAGRAAGDTAIRMVADGIRRCVREVDVVARYGGEEFLIVLPSTHFAGSVTVAERIWRAVGEGKAALGRELTVSIGVALYPSRDVRTKDAVVRAADAALTQAKRQGGDRICVFQQQGYIYTPSVLPPDATRDPTKGPRVPESWRPREGDIEKKPSEPPGRRS
jgi:diguanylate cyclase (GGDEF)-like protein